MQSRISDGAFFQAYKTRARLSLQFYLQLAFGLAAAWFALTTAVIWYQTRVYLPTLNHQYFFRWVLCDILTSTPLLRDLADWLPMYANGALYTLPSFGAWLDGPQFYQQSFSEWLWCYGRWTSMFPIGLAFSSIIWRLHNRIDREHLRGLQLFTSSDLNRQLHGRPWQRGTVHAASSLRSRADQLSDDE